MYQVSNPGISMCFDGPKHLSFIHGIGLREHLGDASIFDLETPWFPVDLFSFNQSISYK